MAKPGISLTLAKRILLHLERHSRYKGDYIVPLDITQEGISNIMGVRQNQVSRAIKELREDGLVHERGAHVAGIERRRKVYFPTDRGGESVRAIWEDIRSSPVTVRLATGEIREVPFGEAGSLVADSRDDFLRLLDILRDGELKADGDRSEGDDPEPDGSKMASKGPIPSPRRFIGRQRELDMIRGALGPGKVRLVTVTGIAGVGKTTLMARSVVDTSQNRDVFWYSGKEWEGLRDFLIELGAFLDHQGKPGFSNLLKKNPKPSLGSIMGSLQGDLTSMDMVLVFDDFQKADGDTVALFRSLVDFLQGEERIRIILGSRQLPPVYDRRSVKIKGNVLEVPLIGLDRESSRELVPKMDPDAFDRIFKLTRGHPLALALLESSRPDDATLDFSAFLEEEIFSRLDRPRLRLLKMAMIYRFPVPADALFLEDDTDSSILSELIHRHLIIERPLNFFSVHDMVENFTTRHMTPRDRKEMHRRAARFYQQGADEFSFVEEIYHLMSAGEKERAARRLVESGPLLVDMGHLDILSLLDMFSEKELDPQLRSGLTGLRAQIYTARGDTGKARTHYRKKLQIARQDRKGSEVVATMGKLGTLSGMEAQWDKTLRINKQALGLARKRGDRPAQAKCLNNMGYALRNLGRHSEAIRMYREAVTILQAIGEEAGTALCHINMGRIHESQNRFENASQEYERALALSNSANFRRGESQSRMALGRLQGRRGRAQNALRLLNEALEGFRSANDFISSAQVLQESGEIRLSTGDIRGAARDFQSGLAQLDEVDLRVKSLRGRIFSLRGSLEGSKSEGDLTNPSSAITKHRKIRAELHERIGDCLAREGNSQMSLDSYKNAYRIVRELNEIDDMARILMAMGLQFRRSNDLKGALERYNRALELLRKRGDMAGVAVSHLNIADVQRAIGNPAGAEKHLALATQYARRSGDRGLIKMVGRAV